MPENSVETVDSVAAQDVVDSAPETKQEEIPSAEESSPKPKTYTESELDAIVKARIDKQNAKHSAEVEAIKTERDTLKAKNAEYEAKEALEEARKAAAAETGAPVDTLDGATEAEIRAQARAWAAFKASQPKYGSYQDSGEQKQPAKVREVPKIF